MLGVEKNMGIGDVELEEGEACYYQKGDEITIDPDVTLSYIDEKIQDILGHFQKDFEGGVSAEKLGAKFGGYGSFLPTYARSPACSQQRTTSEVIDGNTPKSPRFLDHEVSQFSSLASSCSSHPLSLEAGSIVNPKGHGSINGRTEGDGRVSLNSVETPSFHGEEKSEFPYDQKTLKVRLKVGSNNLPVRKIDDIYSGLGLDGSPSPSSNDHYADSGGLSHGMRGPSGNSPTSILKIMTSLLLQGTQLLSPLSEELIRLTEKEKYLRESVSKPLHKEKVKECDSRKDLHEPLREKKTNSHVTGEFLEAGEHRNAGFSLKRETDMNDLACEELVNNALKLPLLSNTQSGPRPAEGTVKSADLPRVSNKGPSSMRSAVEQTFEHPSVREIERKSKGNVGSSAIISILQKENTVDDSTIAKKPSRHKGHRNISSATGLPGQERVPSALLNSRGKQSIQFDVSNNEVIGNQSQEEDQSCAVGRNKLEGDQNQDSVNNFASLKRNNGSNVKSPLPKNTSVNTNKGLKKITNKYEEFFGDLDFEQDDNEVIPNEVSSLKKLLDTKLEENGSTFEDIRMTEETTSFPKAGKPYKEEECSRASSNEKVSSTATGDAILAALAPELEDNWVLCDKCQKWRLLPLGRNPRSLPEKWMCNMLDWLPAMNRCTFSEEETTDAVRALYQVLTPLGTECKPPGHPGNSMSVASSNGVSNLAHNGQMFDQQTSHTGAKKKYKSKYDSSRPVSTEPSQLPTSMTKNHQEKNKSFVRMNHSSLLDANGSQYGGQCSSSLAEKHSNNPHKKNSLKSPSVGVDSKKLKARKRRQSDSDSSRSSKKIKSEDVLYHDENCSSPPPVHLSKSGHCIENNSLDHIPRDDKPTIDVHHKKVKDETLNHMEAIEIACDASLPNHMCDGKSSSKKKRRQGEQGTHSYAGDLPQEGSRGRSEDNRGKVKKARSSNSEGKEATGKKSTSETGRKARKSIDQQLGKERGSSGTAKSSKRDLGCVHPPGASTSSSSKVSGSRKIRTNRQEVKGSPVDSVSSSPLRVLGTDNCALRSRNPQEKDDNIERTLVKNCSPRGSLGVATNKVNHSTPVDSSLADLQDKDLRFELSTNINVENGSSSSFAYQFINDVGSKGDHHNCKNQASENDQDEKDEIETLNGGFHSRKMENGMSLNHGNCIISENEKAHVTSPYLKNEALDDIPLANGKFAGGRSRFEESCVSFEKDEKNVISERSSGIKDFGGISEYENKTLSGCNDRLGDRLNVKENIVLNRDVQDSPKNKLISHIRNANEISSSGKSHSLPPSARYKNDKGSHTQLLIGSHKENGVDITYGDAHGDTSKTLEQNTRGEKKNGSIPSRHSNARMHKVRDQDGSSVRKDSRSHAATTAMKEAKDLKRLADRFKNSGSADSTGMYFEAALKFLYGASLLESGSRENNKYNDIQCIDMYRSTAKFCEFCAHEYERSKDMASASLAYKCMEVSYMRVIYTSHGNINRDRNEVHMALPIVPPGESPASSASDVDNLNNQVTVDKLSASKGMTSPQVGANIGITARNRSSFTRLLELAQDVSAAMDAARKSRATLAAANLRSGDANCGDGFSSVKRALDFNFHDVDGLLRLVRIAKDSISR